MCEMEKYSKGYLYLKYKDNNHKSGCQMLRPSPAFSRRKTFGRARGRGGGSHPAGQAEEGTPPGREEAGRRQAASEAAGRPASEAASQPGSPPRGSSVSRVAPAGQCTLSSRPWHTVGCPQVTWGLPAGRLGTGGRRGADPGIGPRLPSVPSPRRRAGCVQANDLASHPLFFYSDALRHGCDTVVTRLRFHSDTL